MTERTTFVITLAGVIMFTVAFAVGDYFVDASDAFHHWWADIAWTLAAFAAACRCFVTAHKEQKTTQSAWILFGCACLSWFFGMLIWSYLELVEMQSIPFPGLSDIGFLAFAPLMMAGIFVYHGNATSTSLTIKQLAELALIICTTVISLIIILYQPIIEIQESNLHLVTALAYPAVYISALFFGLIHLFTRIPNRNAAAFILLILGLAVHAFTNTLYANTLLGRNYAIGNYLDIFWIIGFGIIFLSASEESIATSQQKFFISITNTDYTKHIEALVPGAVIAWLAVLILAFSDSFTPQMAAYVLPPAFVMAICIAAIGWINQHMQKELYDELLDSENALKISNINLEQKVRDRTKELEISRNEAILSSNAKSEFLSRMNHELRTPMNAVLGFSQILELDESLSREQREILIEIITAGDHLLSLINDILDLQSIEAGKIQVDIKTINIAPIIDQCLSLTEHLTKKKNVSLFNKINRIDSYVEADERKIKQVLINLISNAIKYNRQNGSVTITNEFRHDGYIRISISDTGTGIAKDQQQRIFDSFVRLDHNIAEGSGVGLSITRKLVHAMNGKIGIESTPGVGSTFWIDLHPGQ